MTAIEDVIETAQRIAAVEGSASALEFLLGVLRDAAAVAQRQP